MIGDFKFYEVGGKIRDELLGLTTKWKNIKFQLIMNLMG